MSNPITPLSDCGTGCAQVLSASSINFCNPETKYGGFSRMAISGDPFATQLLFDTPTEWTARLALENDNVRKIIMLPIVGEKPASETTTATIHDDLKVTTSETHKYNIKVYVDIYQIMMESKCNKTAYVWLFDSAKKNVYGGFNGIQAIINFNHIVPESTKELQYYSATVEFTGSPAVRDDIEWTTAQLNSILNYSAPAVVIP